MMGELAKHLGYSVLDFLVAGAAVTIPLSVFYVVFWLSMRPKKERHVIDLRPKA